MQHTVVTDALMEAFVIEGARPLSGSIRAAGNKNAALPIVAACLLADEPITLTNVPAITDVETMLDLAADLGADVQRVGGGEVRITAAGVSKFELDEELCAASGVHPLRGPAARPPRAAVVRLRAATSSGTPARHPRAHGVARTSDRGLPLRTDG
jgi:hypothetical protein